MGDLSVRPTGSAELLSCDLCGDASRSVAGIVQGPAGETAYLVQWSVGKVKEHGAHFDLLMAGDPALIVAVQFKQTSDGPAFMVIDSKSRQAWKQFPQARRLAREAVIGGPLADTVFAVLDAIWLQDERIRELRGNAA